MLLRKIVYWAPRVLAVLYVIFISLFALDIFSEGYTFTETLVGLFMHLLPTLAVVVLLLVAWRRPLIGGALFVLMAGAFVFFFRGNDIVGYLIISGPLFLIGILFLVDFYFNERANDLISE